MTGRHRGHACCVPKQQPQICNEHTAWSGPGEWGCQVRICERGQEPAPFWGRPGGHTGTAATDPPQSWPCPSKMEYQASRGGPHSSCNLLHLFSNPVRSQLQISVVNACSGICKPCMRHTSYMPVWVVSCLSTIVMKMEQQFCLLYTPLQEQ